MSLSRRENTRYPKQIQIGTRLNKLGFFSNLCNKDVSRDFTITHDQDGFAVLLRSNIEI